MLKELFENDIKDLQSLKDLDFLSFPTLNNFKWRAYGNINCFGLLVYHPFYKKWMGHLISDKTLSTIEVVQIIREACNWFIKTLEIDSIWGITPKYNKQALVVINQIGFKRIDETETHVISKYTLQDDL